MRLNAKILNNVADINRWQYAEVAFIQEGQTNTIYIQIVDTDQELGDECPLRYLSQAAVMAVEATFASIDDAEVIVKAGSQAFPDDKSIWKFDLTSSETPGGGSFSIKLTEDGVARSFLIQAGISVDSLDVGGC